MQDLFHVGTAFQQLLPPTLASSSTFLRARNVPLITALAIIGG